MKKIIFAAALAMLFSACTSLQTVSLTSIPAKRDRPIRAEASRVIFLGLNFDNDYVDQVSTDLKSQCQDGMISGVLTKDEVVDYFLMLVFKHRITATAYCGKPGTGKTAQQAVKPRRPSGENKAAEPVPEPEEATMPGYLE